MKRTLFAINYGVAIALCATIWAACSSNPSKTGTADDTNSIADTTAVAPQDTDVVAQEPYHLDFTLKNLLDLLYHHGDNDFETRYVLYPPRPRDGFILIEIEVYV